MRRMKLTVNLTPEEMEQLKARSEELGIPLAVLARSLIKQGMRKEDVGQR